MKITVLAIILAAGLLGCTSGHPVPAEAFKTCIDSGGGPMYASNIRETKFVCLKPGDKLENF